MLKVYAAKWCPHCVKTIQFLKDNNIKFNYIEIEEQPEEVIKIVADANGGDWIVPTLEFNGCWRPGKVYRENELRKDLKDMGVI